MSGLRVLITNITLATRTGTETYIRDLALGLARRGHHPVVYSTDLGDIAREMEAGTVPVIDDLRRLSGPPDVIHGHHFPETLTALLHFPGVPALNFCHDWAAWHDTPLWHPRVRRYVAVDDTCRDRLLDRHAIPPDKVRVVLNSVDLERFPPRGPLPERPRRALVFSNLAAAEDNYLGAVRSACEAAGLTLDVIGQGAGTSVARPGELLGQYDLVFAKGRCALEAMAVGPAVVLSDAGLAGPMVTAAEFDRLRRWNFGRRALRHPVGQRVLLREIARYHPGDAAQVTQRVRAEAGLDGALTDLIDLYREAIEEQHRAGTADAAAEGRAAADGLRSLMPYFREIRGCHQRLAAAIHEREQMRRERDSWQVAHDKAAQQATARDHEAEAVQREALAVHARAGAVLEEMAVLRDDLLRSSAGEAHSARHAERLHQQLLALQDAMVAVEDDWHRQHAKLRAECERLHALLAAVHGSATIRLRNRLKRLPLVSRLARLARRALAR